MQTLRSGAHKGQSQVHCKITVGRTHSGDHEDDLTLNSSSSSLCVHGGEHVCGVNSLLLPFCGLWESNAGSPIPIPSWAISLAHVSIFKFHPDKSGQGLKGISTLTASIWGFPISSNPLGCILTYSTSRRQSFRHMKCHANHVELSHFHIFLCLSI